MSLFVHDSVSSLGDETTKYLESAEISTSNQKDDIDKTCIFAIVNLTNHSRLIDPIRDAIITLRRMEFFVLILILEKNNRLMSDLKSLKLDKMAFTLEEFMIFFDQSSEKNIDLLNKLELEFKSGGTISVNPMLEEPLNRNDFRRFTCEMILHRIQDES